MYSLYIITSHRLPLGELGGVGQYRGDFVIAGISILLMICINFIHYFKGWLCVGYACHGPQMNGMLAKLFKRP